MLRDAPTKMSIKDMVDLCNLISGKSKGQIRVIAHEVRKEYEYIDFWDMKAHDFKRHRIRRLMGEWKFLY